jgi:hypothetical protein
MRRILNKKIFFLNSCQDIPIDLRNDFKGNIFLQYDIGVMIQKGLLLFFRSLKGSSLKI